MDLLNKQNQLINPEGIRREQKKELLEAEATYWKGNYWFDDVILIELQIPSY